MSSQLASIISTIAEQDVTITVNGAPQVIEALGLAALPETADSWRLPTRLILPIGAGRAQGQVQQVKTFKGGSSPGVLVVDWTISDVLLYRAADAGIGLADIAPILMDYVAAYMGILGPLRTSKWSVINVTFPIIGPLEWPGGSGKWYDGVQTQLVIREII